MRTFLEADQDYRAKLEATGDLDSAFTAACAVGKVDWRGNGLTRAVLARMKTYYTAQERIKAVLDKRFAAAAADFFVETVAFYLKVAISVEKLNLHVTSEEVVNQQWRMLFKHRAKMMELAAVLGPDDVKTLIDAFDFEWPEGIEDWAKGEATSVLPVPKEIRADISVWRDGDLLAVIECKTQQGRNRTKWLQSFEERASLLRSQRPHAQIYLLSMTEMNWGGFNRSDPRCGTQFFSLLDKDHWPTDVDPSAPTIAGLVHPVEALFRLVLGR